MSANHELTFQCYVYCLSTNQGPFEGVEHFSFDQWQETSDTLRDLLLDIEWHRKDKKSADAAAD